MPDRRLIQSWLLLFFLLPVAASAGSLSAERQNELYNLLLQDCGSCHGMRLTGGLGPPLTTTALTGKSREFLIHTISAGRPGTPMPPWKNLLKPDEIRWLVDYLLAQKGSGS